MNLSDRKIRQILEQANTIAVVGLSEKPDRESYIVAQYLQDHGYRIIPVNPTVKEVLGQKSYASILDIPESIDVVDIFRKPDAVLPVVEEAIEARAPVVWMQIGVVNHEAAKKAESAGLQVVMDRCMKVEHERLVG